MLKEAWEGSKRSEESVVSYMLLVRERLSRMTEVVQENLSRAQHQQKRWYDSNTCLVCPEPFKIQSVESFPAPANKKHMRRFLGLTGYYRKFIPDYAKTAAPLTDLTRENKPNQVL